MKELSQAELEIMTADILETWWTGLMLETASKGRKRKRGRRPTHGVWSMNLKEWRSLAGRSTAEEWRGLSFSNCAVG